MNIFTDIVISAEQNCFPSDEKDNFDKYFQKRNTSILIVALLWEKQRPYLPVLKHGRKTTPDDRWMPDRQIEFSWKRPTRMAKDILRQPVNMKLDRCQVLSQTLHDADIADFDFGGRKNSEQDN